ncbi:Myosin light chain kinase, smooth muscle [Anthophora plagiata]
MEDEEDAVEDSDMDMTDIPDESATEDTEPPAKSPTASPTEVQSVLSKVPENGKSPSVVSEATPESPKGSPSTETSKKEEEVLDEKLSKSQEEIRKSQDLSLDGKRTSLDQLQKSKITKMYRQCNKRFREIIGKRELKNEELEKQQGDLKHRLNILECSMPAVMVWNIWRMSQGATIPSLQRVLENQFHGPASGEVYCPSTPSRHFDCRVREVEAERKQAQKRVEEARALWAEKMTVLEDKSRRLEEARKVQEETRQRIEQLSAEVKRLREAASKVEDDGSCETGECAVIECKKKWLEKVPSNASIKSADIECLEKLQQLAENELAMKRQIADLERREEAYMRTLQQADELWSQMHGAAAGNLQEQLAMKTEANQKMADRICELEDIVEDLRTRLSTCRGELHKYLSVEKVEALIGKDDDFADVLDAEVTCASVMRDISLWMKQEMAEEEVLAVADLTDADMMARPDAADLATGVARADLIATGDAQMAIRPDDFAYEDAKYAEARDYLAMIGSLSELDKYGDDYICEPDFACNDQVFTETGLTEEEWLALKEGRVTAKELFEKYGDAEAAMAAKLDGAPPVSMKAVLPEEPVEADVEEVVTAEIEAVEEEIEAPLAEEEIADEIEGEKIAEPDEVVEEVMGAEALPEEIEYVEVAEPIEEVPPVDDTITPGEDAKPDEYVSPVDEITPVEDVALSEAIAPDEAITPVDDIKPAEAIAPDEAITPVDEVKPAEAVTLVDEVKPAEAVAPVDEVKPAEAVTPVDEVKPAEAVTPVDEVKPAEAVTPVDEVKPAEAVTPVDEVKTTEAVAPVDEVKPAEAVTPADEVKSVEAVRPDEDAIDKKDIVVPRNEMLSWKDDVDLIRSTVAACPDCVVVKKDADKLATAMAAYTGTEAKDITAESKDRAEVAPTEEKAETEVSVKPEVAEVEGEEVTDGVIAEPTAPEEVKVEPADEEASPDDVEQDPTTMPTIAEETEGIEVPTEPTEVAEGVAEEGEPGKEEEVIPVEVELEVGVEEAKEGEPVIKEEEAEEEPAEAKVPEEEGIAVPVDIKEEEGEVPIEEDEREVDVELLPEVTVEPPEVKEKEEEEAEEIEYEKSEEESEEGICTCPQPTPRPVPSRKIEITQTEITKIETIQMITQTVTDVETQTVPRIQGPKVVTVTRAIDPDSATMGQLLGGRMPFKEQFAGMTVAASSQVFTSFQAKSREAESPHSSLQEVLQCLRTHGAQMKADPEQELRSIHYGRKPEEVEQGKCNCCRCGKTMSRSFSAPRSQIEAQQSKFLPGKGISWQQSGPRTDQASQPDIMCPECKIRKLQATLKAQDPLKKAPKKPTRDQQVCTCATAPQKPQIIKSSVTTMKKMSDQGCMARIARAKGDTKPRKRLEDDSMHCVCSGLIETGTPGKFKKVHCACGDPD